MLVYQINVSNVVNNVNDVASVEKCFNEALARFDKKYSYSKSELKSQPLLTDIAFSENVIDTIKNVLQQQLGKKVFVADIEVVKITRKNEYHGIYSPNNKYVYLVSKDVLKIG